MRITGLGEIPATRCLSVVINVGTDLVATLAVVSALRHAQMPVLLVNCDPTEASRTHFDRLAQRWDFAALEAPVRPHHHALNTLFASVPADLVLLLDSDAELRGDAFVDRLRGSFDVPRVFGAGFIHGPMWLDEVGGHVPNACMYQERPWMHCVMFRTAHVRDAFAAGVTFAPRTIYNDFMWNETIAKALAARFQNRAVPRVGTIERLPVSLRERMRTATLPGLAWARREYYGRRPNYLRCDTGADLYQWCRFERGLVYAGVASALRTPDDVIHYGGITRSHLGRGGGFQRSIDDVETEVRQRLAETYDVDWAELRHGLEA